MPQYAQTSVLLAEVRSRIVEALPAERGVVAGAKEGRVSERQEVAADRRPARDDEGVGKKPVSLGELTACAGGFAEPQAGKRLGGDRADLAAQPNRLAKPRLGLVARSGEECDLTEQRRSEDLRPPRARSRRVPVELLCDGADVLERVAARQRELRNAHVAVEQRVCKIRGEERAVEAALHGSRPVSGAVGDHHLDLDRHARLTRQPVRD